MYQDICLPNERPLYSCSREQSWIESMQTDLQDEGMSADNETASNDETNDYDDHKKNSSQTCHEKREFYLS
jgi:hypothetical protein